MTTEITDVELEKLLGNDSDSDVADTSGASDQKTAADAETADTSKTPKDVEDDISPRAQKRINDLLDENKRLKETPPEKADDSKKTPEDNPEFKSVDEFLNAIQDEPSKKLLKTFAELTRKENMAEISPVLKERAEIKFNEKFDAVAVRVPALKAYKDILTKEFQRNPNQDFKTLLGNAVAENLLTPKIKPIDGGGFQPRREAPDLSTASKDDLYAALEANKP